VTFQLQSGLHIGGLVCFIKFWIEKRFFNASYQIICVEKNNKSLFLEGVFGGLGGGLILFIVFNFLLRYESAWTYLIFFPVFYTIFYFLLGKFFRKKELKRKV